MRLRNKKTGDAVYVDFQIPLSNSDKLLGSYSVTSLKELNESFEDYTPAEPLIKDEKIRKAVRAWAEANGVSEVFSYAAVSGCPFWYIMAYRDEGGLTLDLWGEFPKELTNDKSYTIAELCGEIDCEPVKEMDGWGNNERPNKRRKTDSR